jgi:hypothetical protein
MYIGRYIGIFFYVKIDVGILRTWELIDTDMMLIF